MKQYVSAVATAIVLTSMPAFAAGIVPLPRSIVPVTGTYAVPARVDIVAPSNDARNVAVFAKAFFRERGISARIAGADGPAGLMRLEDTAHDPALGREGYRLTVGAQGIAIAANAGAGLFYGLQTFEQVFASGAGNELQDVEITDTPAYRWRGIHLDVSRHFYPVSIVERYIDVAAHYKLNTFHWHLTDDQGWRIQIKRYPRLTSVGGCRAGTEIDHDATTIDSKRYCGFYTQAQIRQVVAYAKQRYVTVVPEIEMPGHSVAALAAYPDLGCSRRPYAVRETWGVSTEIYCPTEHTFAFLRNVLEEVASLFPGTYIHIGGDEVPYDAWKSSGFVHALMARDHLRTYASVQGYFDRRVEAFLNAAGRRMVGWDEILDGGISHAATVMSWRGESGGIKAAKRGNDVIMSPDGPLYFDGYQGDQNDEPDAIGNLFTLRDVYDYNPTPAGLTAQQSAHIIGVQGNLWTEYVDNPAYLFYMLLPRELALSEIAWTPAVQKNWESFLDRSGYQYAWLEHHGYNFRIPNPAFAVQAPDLQFDNVSDSVRTIRAGTSANYVRISLGDSVQGAAIYYTTDGTTPTRKSLRYAAPFEAALKGVQRLDIIAVAVLPNGRTSTPSELVITRREPLK